MADKGGGGSKLDPRFLTFSNEVVPFTSDKIKKEMREIMSSAG